MFFFSFLCWLSFPRVHDLTVGGRIAEVHVVLDALSDISATNKVTPPAASARGSKSQYTAAQVTALRALDAALERTEPAAIEAAHAGVVASGIPSQPLVLLHTVYRYGHHGHAADCIRVLVALHTIRPLTWAVVQDLTSCLAERGHIACADQIVTALQERPTIWNALAQNALKCTV